MEPNLIIKQATLRQKFVEIAGSIDNKVDLNRLREILTDLGLEQPVATAKKIVQRLMHYALAKNPLTLLKSMNSGKSHVEKPQRDQEQEQKQGEEEEEQQDDEESEEQNEQNLLDPQLYQLSYQQVQKCVTLLTSKIKHQIWKMTAKIYKIQNETLRLSKKSFVSVKDPGHFAKINILVGDEMPDYNSYARLKLSKKVKKGISVKRDESKIGLSTLKKEAGPLQLLHKMSLGAFEQGDKQKAQKSNSKGNSFQKDQQEVNLKLIFATSSVGESQLFANIWNSLYEIIWPMIEGEFPDGSHFLSTIHIATDVNEQFFQITIASHNPDLNELLFAASNFLDVIFKTQVKFSLQFLFEFGFDLSQLIINKNASIYDFLTKNVRIKLNYQGSEYVTALKELMILSDAFEGLKWVADDGESLALIALISSHVLQMNLKFKNAQHEKAQQDTLKQVFNMIREEIRPLLQKMKQQSPETFQLLINALKKSVLFEANIYDVRLKAELYLLNIDKVIFFQGHQLDGDEESNSNEQQSNPPPQVAQQNKFENPQFQQFDEASQSDSGS